MKIDDILNGGKQTPAREFSPLTLAFIGDGVYELYVRCHIAEAANAPAGRLHKEAVKFVKASAQAQAIKDIEEVLTEEELWIFKRGRNAKSPTVPKNADVTDYRLATGFEALIGYLYLEGRTQRLSQICSLAMKSVAE